NLPDQVFWQARGCQRAEERGRSWRWRRDYPGADLPKAEGSRVHAAPRLPRRRHVLPDRDCRPQERGGEEVDQDRRTGSDGTADRPGLNELTLTEDRIS